MLKREYAAGDRVGVISLGPLSKTSEGTITAVFSRATPTVHYEVAWDDGEYANERWAPAELDELEIATVA
jgi:hypothetical protein